MSGKADMVNAERALSREQEVIQKRRAEATGYERRRDDDREVDGGSLTPTTGTEGPAGGSGRGKSREDWNKILLWAAWVRIVLHDRPLADALMNDEPWLFSFLRDIGLRDPDQEEFITWDPPPELDDEAWRILNRIVHTQGRPSWRLTAGRVNRGENDGDEAGASTSPSNATLLWRSRFGAPEDPIKRAAQAVGRVMVSDHEHLTWVGTAWLVDTDIVVTNKHVALEFLKAGRTKWTFQMGWNDPVVPIVAAMDTRDADDDPHEQWRRDIVGVVHVPMGEAPDLALLRLQPRDGTEVNEIRPLRLADAGADRDDQVCVLGYPSFDIRSNRRSEIEKVMSDGLDRKRLAPGCIVRSDQGKDHFHHDCSTLGGNSGSPVLDINTLRVVGVHYGHVPNGSNVAVTWAALRAVIQEHAPDALSRWRPGTYFF